MTDRATCLRLANGDFNVREASRAEDAPFNIFRIALRILERKSTRQDTDPHQERTERPILSLVETTTGSIELHRTPRELRASSIWIRIWRQEPAMG